MMDGVFTIGRLSKETGCNVQTIRYYEQIGLLKPPLRSSGNQRLYDESWAQRLRFIRHARELGFPLDAIRQMLTLADKPQQSCDLVDLIASDQLAAVERRIAQLEAMRAELGRMITQCQGGNADQCRILEVLGDHDLCLGDDHAPRPEGAA